MDAQSPAHSTSTRGAIIGQFKAVAEFDGSGTNQLSLKAGDIVSVREKSEAGWWEGETVRNGQPHAGWFPGNYVKAIEVRDASRCFDGINLLGSCYDISRCSDCCGRLRLRRESAGRIELQSWGCDYCRGFFDF